MQNNARRAMAAGSAASPYTITSFAVPNFSSDDGSTYATINNNTPVSVVGPTQNADLSFTFSPSVGWFGELAINDGSGVIWEGDFDSYNASPQGVLGGWTIQLFISYVGASTLPQAATVTVRNVSDGNVIVDTFTVTFNPEPV